MNAPMRFLDFAQSQAWALLPERAEELSSIAARAHRVEPGVLEAYHADQLVRAERGRERDGVAILDITGPLFKRANMFVRISGATSYEIVRRDLQAALDNPDIKSILLIIDTPGGEANGCDELAAAIYAARDVKPITAYVSGMAASGGYWIASAASRVIVSDAALLGSIGVVLGIPDGKVAEERRGIRTHEFVSSQSPGKRPDLNSPEGKGRIQSMVDDLAEVFIAAVAKYRGVTVETVISNFGAGGIKVGAKAVAAGMADEVGQLEATIATMPNNRQVEVRRDKRMFVDDNTVTGVPLQSASAALSPGARIKAILSNADAKFVPTLAERLAFESSMDAAACLVIIAAARADHDAVAAMEPPKVTQEELGRRYLELCARKGTLGALEGYRAMYGELPELSVPAAHAAGTTHWNAAVAMANGSNAADSEPQP